MIVFSENWTQGMDGKTSIATVVNRRVSIGDNDGPGESIDAALAAVCANADSHEEATAHLAYIVDQLGIALRNMRADE